jgi:multimeric flavodoxin WrbA
MSGAPTVLILNAALQGASGNTAVALATCARLLRRRGAAVETRVLAENGGFAQTEPALQRASAVLIGTGTHWDGWSSLLQKFLEDATPAEGTRVWLGKPAACVVTEHSVGGKGVLSRLQGVLVTLGCTLPPMSGLVLSRAAQIAAHNDSDAARDLWSKDDLRTVCHNLVEAAAGTHRWRTWPVDRRDFRERWIDRH